MAPLYDKPEVQGELVYLGCYYGTQAPDKDSEEYNYDLWFNVIKEKKLVISKSRFFHSYHSFYDVDDLASQHDGLREAIERAYLRGLDLL